MAAKPIPGASNGTYGTELNEFLDVGINADGTLKNTYADGDDPTGNDSESNAMVKAHAYLARTAGFVTAWTQNASAAPLNGYVGSTDDPVGAGMQVAHIDGAAGSDIDAFVSFFVADTRYFELTHSSLDVKIVWTPLVTGGGAPIDQD